VKTAQYLFGAGHNSWPMGKCAEKQDSLMKSDERRGIAEAAPRESRQQFLDARSFRASIVALTLFQTVEQAAD
jgi:hypothetical protein